MNTQQSIFTRWLARPEPPLPPSLQGTASAFRMPLRAPSPVQSPLQPPGSDGVRQIASPAAFSLVERMRSAIVAELPRVLLNSLREAGTRVGERRTRSLSVAERVTLGEKRFAAVLRVGEEHFLVGGGSNDVVLISRLSHVEQGSFQGTLDRARHQQENQ